MRRLLREVTIGAGHQIFRAVQDGNRIGVAAKMSSIGCLFASPISACRCIVGALRHIHRVIRSAQRPLHLTRVLANCRTDRQRQSRTLIELIDQLHHHAQTFFERRHLGCSVARQQANKLVATDARGLQIVTERFPERFTGTTQ